MKKLLLFSMLCFSFLAQAMESSKSIPASPGCSSAFDSLVLNEVKEVLPQPAKKNNTSKREGRISKEKDMRRKPSSERAIRAAIKKDALYKETMKRRDIAARNAVAAFLESGGKLVFKTLPQQ